MRKLFALILVLAGATGAFAADKPADKSANAAASNSVQIKPPLIGPIVIGGKLAGYFYIDVRLTAASQSSAVAIREKTPFILDVFVRDVNTHPLTETDVAKLDRAALGARLIDDARKVVGADKITGITFGDGDKDIGLKFASLRPDQTPSSVAFEDVPVAEAKPAPQKAH